jgi:predicted ATPase
LKVEAKDFAPISSGKVQLKPLTLFIGPNNSGKSYAAMLIHSIFESSTPGLPRRIRSRGLEYFYPADIMIDFGDVQAPRFLNEFLDLVNEFENLTEEAELAVPAKLVEEICHEICKTVYEQRLGEEIIRSYACPLSELVRIGEKSFELGIGFDSYGIHLRYQRDNLRIKEYPKLDTKVTLKATEDARLGFISVEDGEREVLIRIGGRWKRIGDSTRAEGKEFLAVQLMEAVSQICTSRVLGCIEMPCYYLPAARSGILQGHKALAASIVRKAPFVGIERLEIPKFSGVVSDFIASVLNLPEKKGPFYQLAQEFEEELMKGEIVVRTSDEYGYPEIQYNFQETEIPLHRASSTVSELAPLFLYLKYLIGPGSLLIIEEPEAHLHPENQRILAEFLVRLVREDVSIVITTHSEYLLQQLNSFILLSRVEPKQRAQKYQYGEEGFLRPEELAAYVFDYDKSSGGHKVSEVEITEEDGISQEEFLRIHEALYEETITLQKDLGADT